MTIPDSLIGWTVLAITEVRTDTKQNYRRVLTTSDGHAYQIKGVGLHILPLTDAVLFGKRVLMQPNQVTPSPDEKRRQDALLVQLLIEDDLYDAIQLR